MRETETCSPIYSTIDVNFITKHRCKRVIMLPNNNQCFSSTKQPLKKNRQNVSHNTLYINTLQKHRFYRPKTPLLLSKTTAFADQKHNFQNGMIIIWFLYKIKIEVQPRMDCTS